MKGRNHKIYINKAMAGLNNATTTLIIVSLLLLNLCLHWHLANRHTTSSSTENNDNNDPSSFTAAINTRHPLPSLSSSLSLISSSATPQIAIDDEEEEEEDQEKDQVEPYILGNSSVCAACFRSFGEDGGSCHSKILWHLQQQPSNNSAAASFNDAARLVKDREGGGVCGALCHPDECTALLYHRGDGGGGGRSGVGEAHPQGGHHYRSKYWRFDTVGPAYVHQTTLTLTSIPDTHRMPPARFKDIGTYFTEWYDSTQTNDNHSRATAPTSASTSTPTSLLGMLVEYNPGLVRIPNQMLHHLPKGAVYLLSLRVTPANNCFSESVYANMSRDVWRAIYNTGTNHLGLALLDEELHQMRGYEAVIDLAGNLGLKRGIGPVFMDYRLFVLNEEIYIHANMDTVVVSRLTVTAKGYGTDDDTVRACGDIAREVLDNCWDSQCRLHNLYGGDGLRVTLMHQFNTIWSGGAKGKNYALFAVPDTTTTTPHGPEDVYAEINIFPRHQVQRILPDIYDNIPKKTLFERFWKPGTTKSRRTNIDCLNLRQVHEVGNRTVSDVDAPLASFSTVDAHEHWFPGADAPFKSSAHGGACCVIFTPAELNTGGGTAHTNHHTESLFVGIAHTKVSWKPWYSNANVPQEQKDRVPHTHYVSLFYAFDMYPPFTVRAQSGYFCLGHAPWGEVSNKKDTTTTTTTREYNLHSSLTRNRPLRQNNVVFNCPQISFISSFIEKKKKVDKNNSNSDDDDASSTIIGYGLNDCTGRLVEVRKSEIMRLLNPDPMDMLVFEEDIQTESMV